MKKFFSLLTVFVLALSLSIPVGASNTIMYSYNGLVVPSIADSGNLPKDYNIIYVENDVVYWATFTTIKYPVFANDVTTIEGTYSRYKLDGSEWVSFGGSNTQGTQRFNGNLIWTDITVYDGNGDVYLNPTVATVAKCDGSSCPATDVNFDDICDDCGSPLAFNLRQTPDTYEVIVNHSDSLTLKYSYTETIDGTTFNAVYGDNRITVTFDNPVNHYQYKLKNGEWELNASYPNTSGSHAISLSGDAVIQSSDLNIYDENGDLFFQNPLWMTVEKATQGEMENLTSETAGTMKVLVVCGVGLMACLMALNLFGKRWLLFLR